MNRAKLKSYAPQARRDFIQAMTDRAAYFGLTVDKIAQVVERGDVTVIGGREFPIAVAKKRKLLVERINQDGFEQTMEEIAYTWFNRLVAIRYMELHGYLDHGYRVLSTTKEEVRESSSIGNVNLTTSDPSPSSSFRVFSVFRGSNIPEILLHAEHVELPGLKKETVIDLKLAGNKDAELYRKLLVGQCNALNSAMPFLFEKIDDETELLLPDNLLHSDSLIRKLVSNIDAEDCESVEVLGWLYQFYISERKDQVMARKSAVPTEDIPAVTQLFTPHWIVRYLVENSLGRLWLLNRPNSRLREHMPYYIEDMPAADTSLTEPPVWEAEQGFLFGEGDYTTFLWLRPNPRLQGNYSEALWYAVTIDGYAYAREKWGLNAVSGKANRKIEAFAAAGWKDISFPDLRCCLFLIQRGIKWAGGSGPTDDLEDEFHACFAALCKAWDLEWAAHKDELPVLARLDVATSQDFLKITRPEEIRLCDPACGSGHMLTYAFDLLTLIYEEEGYAPSEIPGLILQHNLHGLEICPRAAQLAELALVFKAREKSRRFFQPEHLVRPRIIELRDVRFAENELRDYIHALGLGDLFNQPILRLLHQFEEAKNFGSLIQPCLDERAISFIRDAIEAKDLGGQLFLRETHLKVQRVLEQAEALTQRYHVVVANPPYMGSNQMPKPFKDFGSRFYFEAKADLFSMFIQRCTTLSINGGYAALITMQSWMFLGTYSKFRGKLLSEHAITSMLHLGPRAFDSISGEVVQTTAFALHVQKQASRPGAYFRLVEASSEAKKSDRLLETISNKGSAAETAFSIDQAVLNQIQGSPICYWLSDKLVKLFSLAEPLADSCYAGFGIKTGDNPQFMRVWSEVSIKTVSFSTRPNDTLGHRWYPCTSGGSQRKWYGNGEMVVNFRDGGKSIQQNADRTGVSYGFNASKYYFRDCISWSKLGSGNFLFRYTPSGSIFDGVGLSAFFESDSDRTSILAYLNSRVAEKLIAAIAPTLSLTSGDFLKLPSLGKGLDASVAVAAVSIARADWDNFETSWDFRDQPLLRPGLRGATLEASWRNWEAQSTAAIRRMQELETENNRLFIAAYGLDGELQPEVPEEQITLARAEARRDMAAFLSYAVGCMMGRYSPDHPGLILANAGDTLREFLEKVGKPLTELTFTPDEDGIIPVLDKEWFDDDIVARTRDFLRATFGDESLNANIQFIEQSLGRDLRKYFLTDFYKDHLQTYKKRPIYWLFSSGKQRAFQCLVYLHRYNEGTLARMRTEYVMPLQGRIAARIEQLEGDKIKATSTSHGNKLQKEQDDLKKQQAELLLFDENLRHVADKKISLDLDDGVKVNYARFGDLLAESRAICRIKEDDG